jgi:imidazolonepropionase
VSLLIRNARVVTPAGPRPRRGAALGEVGVRPGTDVLVEGGRIAAVGEGLGAPAGARTIEAGGRVLLPAFVDCHTHLCWAGDRLDEWDMRRRGASYLDILKAGGGIMSTVRAVRAASERDLSEALRERLGRLAREGTLTVEVKSGYGLSTGDELKMLRAIRGAADGWPGTVVPTALLGHALDPGADDFVGRTIRETLPAVHAEFPGVAVDAYCESVAWSRDDCVRLFERARALGHPLRIHADQFTTLGMIPEAVRLGARSVDHLEAATPDDLRALAGSGTFGVVLPCCGFHLDGRYADARAFVDAGGALALATNCNPGSAPCSSMPMAIALAVRRCGLTPAEAIAACTVNAAALLGLGDRGSIEPGRRADLVLLRHRDERMLACEFGGNPVDVAIADGRVVT